MNALSEFVSTPVLDRLGWTLLHSLWQFALIGVLLSAVLKLTRSQRPNVRYLACCAAFLAMAATCASTFVYLPTNKAPIAMSVPSVRLSTAASEAAEHYTNADESIAPVDVDQSEFDIFDREQPTPATTFWADQGALPPRMLPWVAVSWLGGVVLLSLWNVGGWFGVQRLRQTGAKPVSGQWIAIGRGLIERMNIRQRVAILESTIVHVPVVIGWLKPVVLLPVSILGEMSTEQIEAILAHELAHVRRHDYLVNLAQIALETVFFYHPATWWVSRQIRIEREHCCDDAAVRACDGGALALSEALTLIVTSRQFSQAALAATGPGRGSALARVQRLLNPTSEPSRASRGTSAALVVLLLTLCMTFALNQSATGDAPEIAPAGGHDHVAEAAPAQEAAPAADAPQEDPGVLTEAQLAPPETPVERDENAKMGIFIMRTDGSELREIANTSDHSQLETPRWSHDGKRVLFTGTSGRRVGRHFYVVNPDGKELKRLGTHGHADWSPDDSQILFDVYASAGWNDDAGNLSKWMSRGDAAEQGRGSYVQKLDGSDDVKISTGLCPRWSPDGSKIAVTDHKNIRVIDLQTDSEITLFEKPFDYIFAGYNWSPDGKWLALSAKQTSNAKRQLLLVSAEGEKQGMRLMHVGEQGGSIGFSPDGKQLIFADGYKLQTIDVDSPLKKRSKLIAGKRGRAKDPHWSPDGKWIVFAGDRDVPANKPEAEAPEAEAPVPLGAPK